MRQAWSYAGFALFLSAVAGIAFLFYFGGFNSLLSNQSASLPVEVGRAQSHAHPDASIVVLGNSTAAEDFLAQWFNARSPDEKALNLGVPSGHLYLFERMLAVAMRQGVRPRKIILITTPEVLSLRPDFDFLMNDLTLLKTEIDSGDFVRLRGHTRGTGGYVEYASHLAVRPVLYRAELRDFFVHPRQRVEEAAAVRRWLAGFDRQTPMNEPSNSFSVCEAGPLSELKETIAGLRRQGRDALAADDARVLAGYAVRVHQPLKVDAFETVRFRRVLEKLRAVAPVYLAAAPFYDPEFEQYPRDYRDSSSQTIRRVAAQVPGVTVVPDFAADCGVFFDTVHLNRKGGEQFTEYLRARVL
jgi:hypothetical protein